MRSVYLASFLAFASFSTALANDSTAAFGAGGLVFTKSDHIVMQEEDLRISKTNIRVAYKFFNTSDKPITTRVAFPLPEAFLDADGSSLPYYTEETLPKDKNILKFSVTIDGKKQAFQTEDKQRFDQDMQATAHTFTYHWMQTFPAKKMVSVVHEYTPGVGGAVEYGMQDEASGKYCIDAGTQQWIKQQQKTNHQVATDTIAYILKTGANWKGPISKFKLTVKKSDPNEKVSFCGTGVKKLDATTFVMEKTNFTPKQDLHILYLKPYKLGE
ncbi:MAG: DUF4424 domain-containing protein [Thiothrix sp.]|nr:MAG: DUF4424 domain-containing protein [Thiothrix sp.]